MSSAVTQHLKTSNIFDIPVKLNYEQQAIRSPILTLIFGLQTSTNQAHTIVRFCISDHKTKSPVDMKQL